MAEDEIANDGNQKATGIVDTLKKMATNLMELKIKTTVVGEKPKTIETTINLLEGDINNSIDEAFLKDVELHPIRDFHAEQVKYGHEIIKGNVDVVVELAKKLGEVIT